MKKLLTTVFLGTALIGLAACTTNRFPTEPQLNAIHTLQDNGYHDIVIQWEGRGNCSIESNDYDSAMQGFVAVSKEGRIVKGAVCNGKVYIKAITNNNQNV
jgi:hypothetical protein